MIKFKKITFDDFELGQEIFTEGRSVTEAVVTMFAGVSGDMHKLHMNKHYGKRTIFGKNIAHGLSVLTVASGLIVQTGILESVIAFFGMQDWRFLNPVFFDDTIMVKMVVSEKRESSKKDRGNITLDIEILNQDDVVVQKGKWTLMLSRTAGQ